MRTSEYTVSQVLKTEGNRTMSSPNNQQRREVSVNEGGSSSGNGNGPEEKPRLSEHEKKANHIASEQKRRQAIREGFDRLTELVPGLEGQGRSESIVLNKTVAYMRAQLEERTQLIAKIERLGGKVDDGFLK